MKRKNSNVRTNLPKCPTTKKSMFSSEKEAGRAMMRVWSHDPSADIKDLHTYLCSDCKSYHFGHISYFQMSLAKVDVRISIENVNTN